MSSRANPLHPAVQPAVAMAIQDKVIEGAELGSIKDALAALEHPQAQRPALAKALMDPAVGYTADAFQGAQALLGLPLPFERTFEPRRPTPLDLGPAATATLRGWRLFLPIGDIGLRATFPRDAIAVERSSSETTVATDRNGGSAPSTERRSGVGLAELGFELIGTNPGPLELHVSVWGNLPLDASGRFSVQETRSVPGGNSSFLMSGQVLGTGHLRLDAYESRSSLFDSRGWRLVRTERLQAPATIPLLPMAGAMMEPLVPISEAGVLAPDLAALFERGSRKGTLEPRGEGPAAERWIDVELRRSGDGLQIHARRMGGTDPGWVEVEPSGVFRMADQHSFKTGPYREDLGPVRHAEGRIVRDQRGWFVEMNRLDNPGNPYTGAHPAPHDTVLPSAEAAAVRRPETLRTYIADMHLAG